MDRPRRVPESADEQKMISRLRSASAPAHGAIDFADGVFDVVKGHEPRSEPGKPLGVQTTGIWSNLL